MPCEHVFSSSKETMAARRSHIKPELMEALQMLKFSVKKGWGLDFTTGLGWEVELDELETLTMARALIPEDLTAFKQHLSNPKNAK